jgi:flagellar FliL protein
VTALKALPRYAILLLLGVTLVLGLSACGDSEDDSYSLYPYNPGTSFITNIKDSNLLLRCDVVFRLTDQKAAEVFAADNDIIRDAVIKVLRNLSEDDVKNGDMDVFAQMLVDSANEAMDTHVFYSASFDSWVATR